MDNSAGARHEPTVAWEDDEDSDGEFEFPFASLDAAAAADQLFSGSRIRAFYPVFGRVLEAAVAPGPAEPPTAPLGRLFQLGKARTSSIASTTSSSAASRDAAAGELDDASPDSYCPWTPGSSPASSPSRPPRKSGSTGSVALWRRVGELVVGRSRSDGREKVLFLSAPPSPAREHASSPNKATKHPQARGSKAAAGRYGDAKGGSPGARRTYLPYRQDLVGLFANAHGLSRRHHHLF